MIQILSAVTLTDQEFHALQLPSPLQRHLRRADEFTQMSVAATYLAREQMEPASPLLPEACGVVLASAHGPMETNFTVLDTVIEQEPVSPINFSHSVFNGAAGYLSMALEITGCTLTLTDFCFPFFQALQQAMLMLRCQEQLRYCYVLHVDTYSHLFHDIQTTYTSRTSGWPMGATCWLLAQEPQRSLAKIPYQLEQLELVTQKAVPPAYLQCQEQCTAMPTTEPFLSTTPLATSKWITQNIDNNPADKVRYAITAEYGSIELILHRAPQPCPGQNR